MTSHNIPECNEASIVAPDIYVTTCPTLTLNAAAAHGNNDPHDGENDNEDDDDGGDDDNDDRIIIVMKIFMLMTML